MAWYRRPCCAGPAPGLVAGLLGGLLAGAAIARAIHPPQPPPTYYAPQPYYAGRPSYPAYQPAPSTYSRPPAFAPGTTEIALSHRGLLGWGTEGLVDGIGVDFQVDTGADLVQIPMGFAAELYQQGQLTPADILKGDATMGNANGSTSKEKVVRLHSVTIGDHTVYNVLAVVSPKGTPALLGQTFLRHFASVSIDNRRHTLVLGPQLG